MQIHKPRSLRELSVLLKEYPGIRFIAGGTDLMRRMKGEISPELPPAMIALEEVEELGKIKRRESNIEIGACVTLEKLLLLGPNIIPDILLQVLSRIATPAVRNYATLGGNIMLASPFADVALPLLLLDARIETRRLTTHTWTPLARFLKIPGKTALSPAEILTMISVPLVSWDVSSYEKLNVLEHPEPSVLKFAAVARVYRGTVTDFRMAFGGINPLFTRNREIEAMVIGMKIPFTQKKINQLDERIGEYVSGFEPSFLPDKYHRAAARRLASAFLEKTSSYRGPEKGVRVFTASPEI